MSNRIEYRARGLSRKSPLPITDVILDGKKVGVIVITRMGKYMYVPKSGRPGTQFETEQECRRSLESED